MSTTYKATFIKKEENGKEHMFVTWFGSNFRDVIEELDIVGVRKEKRISDWDPDNVHEYEAEVTMYRFSSLYDYIRKMKEKREKYRKGLEEKKSVLYKVSSIDVYDRIKEEIAEDEGFIEFLDTEINFAEQIHIGVTFHFLYAEDVFYDNEDILIEVEVL